MQDLWVAFPRKTVTHVIFRLPNVYTILYIHINVRFRLRYRKYSFKKRTKYKRYPILYGPYIGRMNHGLWFKGYDRLYLIAQNYMKGQKAECLKAHITEILFVISFILWDCETFDDLGPSKYHYFMNFCFQSVKMELWIFIFSSKIQISHSKLPLLFNPSHNCATLPNITIFLWTPIFKYATVMYLDVLFTIPRERSRDSFESICLTHGVIWGHIWVV